MANQWDTLGRTFHTSCVREQIFLYIIFTGFHLGLNVMSCVVLSCCNTDLFDLQDARSANLALGLGPEERFFNKLEDDVSRIIQQEKRREQYSNSQGQEVNTSTEHEPVSRPVQIIKNTCTNLQYMNKPCTNDGFFFFYCIFLKLSAHFHLCCFRLHIFQVKLVFPYSANSDGKFIFVLTCSFSSSPPPC